ncbi:MAG TPA: amidohydrolase [Candidatus Micrarchaeia archaeon]|nr:amidohydrolase [Candidatus Micrarchaeia archaeon]
MTGAADLIVRNGRVLTMDAGRPAAQMVAMAGEHILLVGADDEAAELTGPRTEVIDARGGSVLPGFVDAHNHARLGSDDADIDLAGADSLGEIRRRITAGAAGLPADGWVVGEGWNPSALAGRMPTASDLDGTTAGRPAFLLSYDVHSVWLNRTALERFGVGAGAAGVAFGTVDRDPTTGAATGIVRDFAVLGLSRRGLAALEPVVPHYGRERQYRRLATSLERAARSGITTLVEPQNSVDDLWLFERARAEGRLRCRIECALLCLPGTTEAELQEFIQARARLDDDHLRVAAVKLYADDVVEPHTAAFFEPYATEPRVTGEPFWAADALAERIGRLEALGFPAFIHATGDRGIHLALDAVAAARVRHGSRDRRHQIVHVECPLPSDIPRFRELGVTACMQPRHAAPDLAAAWRDSVGPVRERRAWPLRSLHDAGALLALSSDWNVAEMEPLIGIYSALTRAALDGSGAWLPEETLDLGAALHGYTTGGARAIFAETSRGALVPGRYADLVVCSDDLQRDPVAVARNGQVVLTVRGGEVVHRLG